MREKVRIVKIEHDFYSLYYSVTFKNEDDGKKALYRIYALMKRIQEKHFADISFLIGLSQIDGKTAINAPQTTGNRGRRPRIIISQKPPVDWHIHSIATGNKVSSFMQEALERINKNEGPGTATKRKCRDSGLVPYVWQQSTRRLSYGDFDFSQCKNDLYIEQHE